MDNATIIDFTGRDAVADPLTELLRKGARELLQAAVEAERDTFLAEFAERRMAARRLSAAGITGAHRADRDRAGHGESAEGPGQGRYAGDVPLGTCAALPAELGNGMKIGSLRGRR